MSGFEISSKISPIEMSEMNQADARKIDVALGVITNDIPSTIAGIKGSLDDVSSKLASLRTRSISFNVTNDIENLAKCYDSFSSVAVNYAGYFEIEIMNIINLYDKSNSLDGTLTVDNTFIKNLPFLGTIAFTLLSYLDNGKFVDDLPQLALDMTGNILDNDFNESLGNLIYNGVEYISELRNWNFGVSSSVAAGALITVESLYGVFVENTDSRQDKITFINAAGDSIKLIAGNAITKYVAIPVGQAVFDVVAGKIVGSAAISTGAKIAGVAGGGLVGIGIVVVGELAINYIVDPIVDELTGEAFITGTTIPKNGGLSTLYSQYQKSIGYMSRTSTLNGMTVSNEFLKEMAQLDPIETILGLDGWIGGKDVSSNTTYYEQLELYLDKLKSIPKDSSNFEDEVKFYTESMSSTTAYASDYVHELIRIGFDPYKYAMEN